MKPWWKLVRPKQDIIDGDNVDLGMYAIHLDQIASGHKDTPEVYLDPEMFFKNTVFTKGLGTVIRHVHNRLSGKGHTGSVINLNTAFGGGKTHTLATLYHLFRVGEEARKWLPRSSLDSVGANLDKMPIPTARTLVWVGANYSHKRPDSNGMKTPWGQLLAQLGPEAKANIEPFDKELTRPDQDTIRDILTDQGPILILMDEVLNAMDAMRGLAIGETTLNHQFRQFYMNLTNVAAGHPGIVVVNSFSKSTGNISEKDEADIELLSNVSGRVDESIATSSGNEVAQIIRRRLFDDVSPEDEKAVAQTIKEWTDWTIRNQQHLSLDLQISEVPMAFGAAYPFHPRTLQVFQKKWQGLPSFGRTRGTLRMLALWAREAYLQATKSNSKETMLTLGSAPLDDELFANTVYGEMGDRDLAIPVRSDVAGDKAWAVVLDSQAKGPIRALCIHQQVATAVFFESVGGHKQTAASTGEVKWAICGPSGSEFTDIDTCLENLDREGHYFRSRNKRHSISPRATLNKLVRTEKAGILDDDINRLVLEAIKAEVGRTTDLDVIAFPTRARDVPDSPCMKICILQPDVYADAPESSTKNVASALLDKSNRQYRRHIAFLTTSQGPARLREAARNHLTYQTLDRNASSYQLEESDKAELPTRLRQTMDDLKDEVWNAYRELWIAEGNGLLSKPDILGLMNRSMSQKGLAGVVEERLFQQDICTRLVSPRVISNWPSAFEKRPWPLRSIRDNVFQSSSVVRARLVNEAGLRTSIANWVKNGNAALVELDEGGVGFQILTRPGTDPGPIEIADQLALLRPDDVPPEGPTPPETSSEMDSPENSNIREGSTIDEMAPPDASEAPRVKAAGTKTLRITIAPKQLARLAMDLAINLDADVATIVIDGTPRDGVENAIRALEEKVKGLGGKMEVTE